MTSEPVDDVLDEALAEEEVADALEREDAVVTLTVGPSGASRDLQLVDLTSLAGVPLWYERDGRPRPHAFPVAASFRPVLERTVEAVRARAPAAYGELVRISSAGIYVAKPGFHGEGRACDWDRFVFERVEIAPIERDAFSRERATRVRYWALVAICRSVSAYVLHAAYDDAHADHIHQDNAVGIRLRETRSNVTLVQSVLNEIHGHAPPLAVDGLLGPLTAAALASARQRLRIVEDPREDPSAWRRFLRRSGRLGLRLGAP